MQLLNDEAKWRRESIKIYSLDSVGQIGFGPLLDDGLVFIIHGSHRWPSGQLNLKRMEIGVFTSRIRIFGRCRNNGFSSKVL